MADSNSSSAQESDEPLKEVFLELCHGLNLDSDSQEAAWVSFKKIDESYLLEGEKLHWVCCALYVACRETSVQTADEEKTIEGNGVSLVSLLKKTKLSLLQFFQKMKKWLDMANLGQKFRERIDLLERNYNVSSIVFKKVERIFYEIFRAVEDTPGRALKGRARKKQACTVTDLFNFCWTLYIRAKGNFPAISDDLVNSYHLLLCCLDLMFINVLISKGRRDLLNPKFQGLPEDYMNKDFSIEEMLSSIEIICKRHDGIVIESKEINEHYWKPFIRKLFTDQVLKGNTENLTGLIDAGNFEYNVKHLNQDYEEHVLLTGDLDERVFLGDDANNETATPSKLNQSNSADFDEIARSHLRRNLQDNFDRTSLAPLTPLTGRRYLKEKDHAGFTPISSATQSVSRLQNHLVGYKASASESLIALFEQCQKNPKEKLDKLVQQLGETFSNAYTQRSSDRSVPPCSTSEFAKNRLTLALVLFYKVLEDILKSEKKIHPDLDIGNLVEQDLFVTTLMACCLEIVIFSYNSQRKFPWIMRTFDLSAFHFYKVIEVVIRAIRGEDGFSRDVVKHLNRIEETILERLAWEENSPLYEALQAANNVVPSCESVCPGPPSQTETTSTIQPAFLLHKPMYKLAGDKIIGFPAMTAQNSPNNPSLADRYSSPPPKESAKRKLFGSTTPTSASSTSAAAQGTSTTNLILSPGKGMYCTISPAKVYVQQGSRANGSPARTTPLKFSLITSPSASPSKSSPAKGNDMTSPQKKGPVANASPAKSVKRIGSLGLFFRKVYHLASVRLTELCAKLGISDELQRRIWTCFEFSITNRIGLMKDRHLDQMIMCAVYVMSKVTKEDKTFHEIMRCYRQQPQASSEVYRNVFIWRKEIIKPNDPDNNKPSDGTPDKNEKSTEEQKLTPTRTTRSASKATKEDQKTPEKPKSDESATAKPGSADASGPIKQAYEEKFGDLIEFYNLVYVKEIKEFALRFAPNAKSLEAPPLSPLPVRRRQPASPRKVSNKHELYVSPIKDIPVTPRSSVLYCFDESPAGRLQDINRMINQRSSSDSSIRRLSMLEGDEDSGPSAAKRVPESNGLTRRLKELKQDRNNR